MTNFNNPRYFPRRDTLKTEQVYCPPVINLFEDITLEPTRKPRLTLSNNDDVALKKFKDTLGKIESTYDYYVKSGFNKHYLDKSRWAKPYYKVLA